MLTVYGSDLCPDCVNCKTDFERAGVIYEYRPIGENLQYFKEFLSLRDKEEIFVPVKEAGKIGIPCIVEDDGSVSLTWEKYL